MYTMVLMMAVSTSGDSAAFFKHKGGCNGCTGAVVVEAAPAPAGCTGGDGASCHGSKHKLFGGLGGGLGLFKKHKSKGCHGAEPAPAPACCEAPAPEPAPCCEAPAPAPAPEPAPCCGTVVAPVAVTDGCALPGVTVTPVVTAPAAAMPAPAAPAPEVKKEETKKEEKKKSTEE
jgi:hypothetical protein